MLRAHAGVAQAVCPVLAGGVPVQPHPVARAAVCCGEAGPACARAVAMRCASQRVPRRPDGGGAARPGRPRPTRGASRRWSTLTTRAWTTRLVRVQALRPALLRPHRALTGWCGRAGVSREAQGEDGQDPRKVDGQQVRMYAAYSCSPFRRTRVF